MRHGKPVFFAAHARHFSPPGIRSPQPWCLSGAGGLGLPSQDGYATEHLRYAPSRGTI
jgi:hypothetical protein